MSRKNGNARQGPTQRRRTTPATLRRRAAMREARPRIYMRGCPDCGHYTASYDPRLLDLALTCPDCGREGNVDSAAKSAL